MDASASITNTVLSVIDDINAHLPTGQHIQRSIEANLFGKDAPLDSLGLVSFIVAVEARVAEAHGVAITLADEKALSRRNSPFQSVRSLIEYIEEVLQEERADAA